MNWWIVTTLAFACLALASWLVALRLHFLDEESRRQAGLHYTEVLRLRRELDTSNARYASILVRLDVMKGENIDLRANAEKDAALYQRLHDENTHLLAQNADLREALETAQKTVPMVEAPKPPRRKRTEVKEDGR